MTSAVTPVKMPAVTATIPENVRVSQPTVAAMLPGEDGWVTSWSVAVDDAWQVWLVAHAHLLPDQGGTADTHVRLGAQGYEVDAPQPRGGGWSKGELCPTWDYLPIARFEVRT